MTQRTSAPCFNISSPWVRRALAAGCLALTGVVGAQDPDDGAAAGEAAASGGACLASASLGALALAPGNESATPAPEADAAAGASAAGTEAPVYQAVMPEGFVSLAGNVPPLVASCVAAGMPATGSADADTSDIAAAADVAPAEEPAPSPAPEVAPEPAPEMPRASVVAAEPRPAPAPRPRPRKPPAEALKTWWPAAEAGKLNLRFAGEAAFGEAIALLFDAPFSDPSSLAQHVEVKTRAGKTVEAKWQVVKSNPQMVALRVPPGLYQVRVGESLAAANGLRFQRTAEGKIFVR